MTVNRMQLQPCSWSTMPYSTVCPLPWKPLKSRQVYLAVSLVLQQDSCAVVCYQSCTRTCVCCGMLSQSCCLPQSSTAKLEGIHKPGCQARECLYCDGSCLLLEYDGAVMVCTAGVKERFEEAVCTRHTVGSTAC